MQAVFTDIVNGDMQKVQEHIEKKPALVNAVAAGQPKQYAGQSALQIAIRTANFDIAKLLLVNGADPNFADTDSPSGWAKSVLHDAAVAAVMRSRWMRMGFNAKSERIRQPVNADKSNKAYEILVALIEAGANVTAVDSKGATPLGRAAQAAHDVLPRRKDGQPKMPNDKPLNRELIDDVSRIFRLFLENGASLEAIEPQLTMSLSDYYKGQLVGKFFDGTVKPDADL